VDLERYNDVDFKRLEVVASIEKKYKVIIPEAEIPAIRSLQNVYDLLGKLLDK
jgi:acyl carrier protein